MWDKYNNLQYNMSGCLENTDLQNTDHRPQTLKTQT